jgi:heme exporter protein D
LLHGKMAVVANPSYAAYTWSAVGVDVPQALANQALVDQVLEIAFLLQPEPVS